MNIINSLIKQISCPFGHLKKRNRSSLKNLYMCIFLCTLFPETISFWPDKYFKHVKTNYLLTISVIMMGRPYVISLVDSMRMTVRLMVMRTTPPRKAAAPIRANVPEYICIPRFLKHKRETVIYKQLVIIVSETKRKTWPWCKKKKLH